MRFWLFSTLKPVCCINSVEKDIKILIVRTILFVLFYLGMEGGGGGGGGGERGDDFKQNHKFLE